MDILFMNFGNKNTLNWTTYVEGKKALQFKITEAAWSSITNDSDTLKCNGICDRGIWTEHLSQHL